jgi:hypothetical protein
MSILSNSEVSLNVFSLYNQTSCFKHIKFTTEDYFTKHTKITTKLNWEFTKVVKIQSKVTWVG